MNYNYSIELLNKVMKDFSIVTGNNIALYDVDFNLLGRNYANLQRFCALIQTTSEGKRRCHASDFELLENCAKYKAPQTHICHAGLTDMCIPIKYNDSVTAYIVLGQIKNDNYTKDIMTMVGFSNLSYFYKRFKELNGITPKQYRAQNKENLNIKKKS